MAKKDFTSLTTNDFLGVQPKAQADKKEPVKEKTEANRVIMKRRSKPQPETAGGSILNSIEAVQKECKKVRLQLVLRPSTMERLRATAQRKGMSVNELCSQLFDLVLDK